MKTTNTTIGVMKAIVWLREMGRPILADKMERGLLYADTMGQIPNTESGFGTRSLRVTE